MRLDTAVLFPGDDFYEHVLQDNGCRGWLGIAPKQAAFPASSASGAVNLFSDLLPPGFPLLVLVQHERAFSRQRVRQRLFAWHTL